MSGISGFGTELVDSFHWGFSNIAKLTDKIVTTRNSVGSIIAGIIFLEKLPPYLKELPENFQNFAPVKHFVEKTIPSLSIYRFRLETAKDFMVMLDWFVTAAEITKRSFWQDSGAAKIGNRVCKIIYGTIETFLIIPNKWNWIDLGGLCNSFGVSFISYTNIVIVKDFFVLAASGFGLYNAGQDWYKARSIVHKNKVRENKLADILRAPDETRRNELLTAYEQGKNKTKAVAKAYLEIIKLDQVIVDCQNKIALLETAPGPLDTQQIRKQTQELEVAKASLVKKEEKVRRVAYFSAANLEEDPLAAGRRAACKEYFLTQCSKLIADLPNGDLKNYIRTQYNGTQEQRDGLYTDLKTKYDGNDPLFDGQRSIMGNLFDKMDALENRLIRIIHPPIGDAFEENAIRKITEYKIAKTAVKISLNESAALKAGITGGFEITKIAIVTLGLLFTTGLTLTALAPFAATLATVSMFTGLAVGIVGGIKTIYDTFYWEDPANAVMPTTNLA